ncbi:polysaccharide lyase [Pandoraea sp. NPDC087047]|uniref:polysaccharide lyase n=1 Tax=Pandoraea sp. NPDC087047 TaxID=3364390 RepID=UPI003824A4F9
MTSLAILLFLAPRSVVWAHETLLAVDFDRLPIGAYSADAFLADWHVEPHASAGVADDRLAIVADPLGATHHVLRVTYRAGRIGGGSAMTFNAPLGDRQSDVWLEYRVMFPSDFTWVRGGKLPGLGGGDTPTGCVADGRFDGFTTRLMWREAGQAFGYLYFPGKESRCGDYVSLQVRFQKGRWHTVTQHVQLNDPGQANGTFEQFVDGRKVLDLTGKVWRQRDRVSVDAIKMDTFFGGSTLDWSPRTDQFVYFDAFRVWSGRTYAIGASVR